MNYPNPPIESLFFIPDESSFIKKLILSQPRTFNEKMAKVYELLQEVYPGINLIQKDAYFSLVLPTESEGIMLEAMIITTEFNDKEYMSIYHRIIFDHELYEIANPYIESDAFLRYNNIITNFPLPEDANAIASLLNYQLQEALSLEISILTLADSTPSLVTDNILPYLANALISYMIASRLDGLEYEIPRDLDTLSKLVARYGDLAIINVIHGLEKLENLEAELQRIEDSFIPEYASSTSALMLIALKPETAGALLDDGGFAKVKEFLLENEELYGLQNITGTGENLVKFSQLIDPDHD